MKKSLKNRFWFAIFLLVFTPSCQLTPGDGQFYCQGGGDCPPGWQCGPSSTGQRRCYENLELATDSADINWPIPTDTDSKNVRDTTDSESETVEEPPSDSSLPSDSAGDGDSATEGSGDTEMDAGPDTASESETGTTSEIDTDPEAPTDTSSENETDTRTDETSPCPVDHEELDYVCINPVACNNVGSQQPGYDCKHTGKVCCLRDK